MALIEQLGQLSTVDPRIALRQPLEQVVSATLDAACESPHSRRSYQNAIGLFVQYLDQRGGERLPEPYQTEWRPFAVDEIIKQRKRWYFNPPALILRLFVDATVLDGFRQWRLREGDAASTVNQREYAVRSFLAVAYRDGILTHEQAQAMNIKSFRARRKAVKQTVGRRLAAHEVQALRAAVKTRSRKGKRDLAILDMMLFLGLRREEVTSVLMENFVLDHGHW
jgi:integrase